MSVKNGNLKRGRIRAALLQIGSVKFGVGCGRMWGASGPGEIGTASQNESGERAVACQSVPIEEPCIGVHWGDRESTAVRTRPVNVNGGSMAWVIGLIARTGATVSLRETTDNLISITAGLFKGPHSRKDFRSSLRDWGRFRSALPTLKRCALVVCPSGPGQSKFAW